MTEAERTTAAIAHSAENVTDSVNSAESAMDSVRTVESVRDNALSAESVRVSTAEVTETVSAGPHLCATLPAAPTTSATGVAVLVIAQMSAERTQTPMAHLLPAHDRNPLRLRQDANQVRRLRTRRLDPNRGTPRQRGIKILKTTLVVIRPYRQTHLA